MSDKSNSPPSSEKPTLKPIDRTLSVTDKFVDAVTEKYLPDVKVPKEKRFLELTPDQKDQLEQVEKRALIYFSGQLDELESALGMLRMGHHFGWKVLYLIHSKKTIRKYEEILDIKIRDLFLSEGPSAQRSVGLEISKRFSNFWKVVSGELAMTKEEKESRRKIE